MKHLIHYFNNYQAEILTMPEPSLGIVVVIPCFNEPDVAKSLKSLFQCTKPLCSVEVLVIINFGEHVDEAVKANCLQNYKEVQQLSTSLSANKFTICPILKDNLPHKHAGVGLARKIGMDEAASRFMKLNKADGLILCFDADSTCDDNYFTAIEEYHQKYKNVQAGSVCYEHPLSGHEFTDDIYTGIAEYELHLRYYNQACRMVGLPFAYHTVGSSMFCTASAYAKVGGMNKRKAGEDFYFLQKLIPLGNFAEVNTTRIIPSPRISDRVPFGTGRAMMKYIDEQQKEMLTYSLEAFKAIEQFVKCVPNLFRSGYVQQKDVLECLHPFFALYLKSIKFYESIDELNANSSDYIAFEKRFFKWFDAFRTLKFMNWVHYDGRWAKSPISIEASKLLTQLQQNTAVNTSLSAKELLNIYRQLESKSPLQLPLSTVNNQQ